MGESGEQAATDEISVTVTADPRTGYSAAERETNYQALLEIQQLRLQAVEAVEQIVAARKDLDTIDEIIARRDDARDSESLKALKERSSGVRKSLNELEKTFRVPPDTKGAVYDDDTVVSRIGLAEGYVSSTLGAPSATARVYIDAARQATNAALQQLQAVINDDVVPLQKSVDEAGITLLSTSR
jgi:hypothetical protein